MWYTAMA